MFREDKFHAGVGRANAQPPGGHSSISFNDGSDSRRPPIRNQPIQTPSRQMQQPPGGRTSFAFDDRVSRPGDDVADVDRRHTNGLRKLPPPQYADNEPSRQAPGGRSSFAFDDGSSPPHYADNGPSRQAPGGRSSFAFDDNSSRPPPRAPPGADALDELVSRNASACQTPYGMQHPPSLPAAPPAAPPPPPPPPYATASDPVVSAHRTNLAPPGGRTTFSLGWGADNGVNHHHAYYARRQDASGRGDYAAKPGGFCSQFAQQNPPSFGGMDPPDHQSSWGGRGPGPMAPSHHGAAGGYAAQRPSIHVAAPPGGASSIVFG